MNKLPIPICTLIAIIYAFYAVVLTAVFSHNLDTSLKAGMISAAVVFGVLMIWRVKQ